MREWRNGYEKGALYGKGGAEKSKDLVDLMQTLGFLPLLAASGVVYIQLIIICKWKPRELGITLT